jgi:hypothetical protein
MDRAREALGAAQQLRADLEAQAQAEIGELGATLDPLSESLDIVTLKPKRTELEVQVVALAWVPMWMDVEGRLAPAYR